MAADRKPLTSRLEKRLIASMAAFFLIQIAIDCSHSVTAFPFVHYGMFSESFSAPDSLLSYELTVNGRRLNPHDFRIYQWDMIQQPLAAFDKQRLTMDFASDKQQFRTTLPGIYSLVSSNLDNAPALAANFHDWYRNYLSRVIGRPVQTLLINRTWYRYTPSGLILLHSTPWIELE